MSETTIVRDPAFPLKLVSGPKPPAETNGRGMVTAPKTRVTRAMLYRMAKTQPVALAGHVLADELGEGLRAHGILALAEADAKTAVPVLRWLIARETSAVLQEAAVLTIGSFPIAEETRLLLTEVAARPGTHEAVKAAIEDALGEC